MDITAVRRFTAYDYNVNSNTFLLLVVKKTKSWKRPLYYVLIAYYEEHQKLLYKSGCTKATSKLHRKIEETKN